MSSLVNDGPVGTSQPVAILLMADYGADPLWRRYETPEASRGIALDLDSVSLSARLKHELRAWAARFDALSKSGYEWPSVEDERTWVADGRALLEPVRHELGPDYEVIYFADGD